MTIYNQQMTEHIFLKQEHEELRKRLRELGMALTSQETKVLNLLLDHKLTQEAIAINLGVSRQRITTVRKNILKKLKVLAELRLMFRNIDAN